MSDPLGIEALIARKRQEIDEFSQPADTWQVWLSHPITKHLLSTIQMDIYTRKNLSVNQAHPDVINALEPYLSFAEGKTND
jgi:hypothetical protein